MTYQRAGEILSTLRPEIYKLGNVISDRLENNYNIINNHHIFDDNKTTEKYLYKIFIDNQVKKITRNFRSELNRTINIYFNIIREMIMETYFPNLSEIKKLITNKLENMYIIENSKVKNNIIKIKRKAQIEVSQYTDTLVN